MTSKELHQAINNLHNSHTWIIMSAFLPSNYSFGKHLLGAQEALCWGQGCKDEKQVPDYKRLSLLENKKTNLSKNILFSSSLLPMGLFHVHQLSIRRLSPTPQPTLTKEEDLNYQHGTHH